MAERAKPVKEQRSALQCSKYQKWFCSRGELVLQCSKYQKWFCSRGELAVHKCRESREPLTETPAIDEDSALLARSSLRRAT